ncbi:BQ2448_2250 [Microbotryum intermedium]|uniref:BQ2448_2250 protein n=1 Tax=Microbotryum intermedium TaxID=269621 RepID=A0A238F5M3_9BASI|nr:BQ2448_2250 [Microbotryum intermedium]
MKVARMAERCYRWEEERFPARIRQAATAVRGYEQASASKLSKAKSFLYPLGSYRDHPIATHLGTWRLSNSQFRYLGI